MKSQNVIESGMKRPLMNSAMAVLDSKPGHKNNRSILTNPHCHKKRLILKGDKSLIEFS